MNARSSPPPRRLFLAAPPAEGRATLLDEDREHAVRVLRAAVGDELLGLDGRGGAWRLEVVAAGRRTLELAAVETFPPEPAPGAEDAPLPRIELWMPLPKAGRAEDAIDRLTQLGAARIAALVGERCEPHAREIGPRRLERLLRRAREACKQSGRRWLPQIDAPASLEERIAGLPADAKLVRLDPHADHTLGAALGTEWGTRMRAPLVLALGPEGGFSPAEERRLDAAGATPARIAPHVLRIETAAEAACAVAAHAALGRAPARRS